MSQPSRPNNEEEAKTDIGNFPNGMPRVVEGKTYVDGIMHIWYNGADRPVWSDHELTVEMGWAACTHTYPYSAYEGAPVEIKSHHCGYEPTAQEAFDIAVRIQQDLEATGEFVPIYVRY